MPLSTPSRFRSLCLLASLCLGLVIPHTVRAVFVGVYDVPTEEFTLLINLNDHVGATALYNQGVLGERAIVANIESGFVGQTNAPLGSQPILRLPTSADGLGQVTDHATMTGHVLAARGDFDPDSGNNNYFIWEFGLAPLATFYSGAIATSFGEAGAFDISDKSFFTPYYHAMKGWTDVNGTHAAADVINSSWGDNESHAGNDLVALSLDALIYETKKLVVASAGNDGPGSQAGSPASAMNTLAVGALGGPTSPNPYTTIADFSSGGPNDLFIPDDAAGTTGTVVTGARAVVDIVAPGDGFILAAEGSQDSVYVNAGGTSFAAPAVAGGLALMVDAGRQLRDESWTVTSGGTTYIGAELTAKLLDARVMKALLLTSADRNLPGWNNGQTTVDLGGGKSVIRTTQSLDWNLGAGAANFTNAVNLILKFNALNFTSGGNSIATPVLTPRGPTYTVGASGWDLNTVTFTGGVGTPLGYEIETLLHAQDTFAISIAWFTEAAYQATLGEGTADVNLTGATFGSFLDLNLKVYLKIGEAGDYELFAESVSLYNAVEFLQFEIPYDAYLRFEVLIAGEVYNFTDAGSVDFGIAWQTTAVPEPAAYVIIVSVVALHAALQRRRCRPRES